MQKKFGLFVEDIHINPHLIRKKEKRFSESVMGKELIEPIFP